MGGNVGEVAQGGRARGEMGGGAPESSVGATKRGLVSLKNLTTGLIWLVTR